MRTKLRSKFTLLFMTLGLLLAVPAIALADNAVSDGDGVTPITNQDMAFGNVGCNVASNKDALIAIQRTGSGTNVFKDGSTVTVSVQSVTGAGLSAQMGSPNTITLPSNWALQANNTLSNSVSSTVTVNSSVAGPGSGTVTYAATGKNSSDATITRTDVMNVTWTTGSCDTEPPSVSSISTADANPTNTTGNLHWTVTFSENVSGVDTGDFALDSSGLGGSPAISSVTPDPQDASVYTVTASSGSGSGNLGLNLNDNDTIVDGASNKLGGTGTGVAGGGGTGNGSFVGDVYVIDRDAPTVTPTALKGVDPNFTDPYSAGDWTNKDVQVTFACEDTGGDSGLTSTSGDDVQKFTTNTSASGTTATFNGTCEDNAGNAATSDLDFSPIKIDKTAPTVGTASAVKGDAPNFTGATAYTADTWTNKDVKVSWSCSDSLSGPVNASDSETVTTEGDASSVTPSCEDNAGNTASGSAFSPIKIDKTAPTLSPSVTPNPVVLGGTATASAGANDSLSGVASSSCGTPDTSTVTTASGRTVSCTATDNAGNTNSANATYRVVYERDGGILQPINPDNTSLFSRGKAVPVKFKLKGDEPNGFSVSGWTLQKVSVSCTAFDSEDLVVEQIADNPSQTFRYDSSADQYIINADLKSQAVGTCWKAKVNLNDGTTLESAVFKLQK